MISIQLFYHHQFSAPHALSNTLALFITVVTTVLNMGTPQSLLHPMALEHKGLHP
jgi:hypothetical protein